MFRNVCVVMEFKGKSHYMDTYTSQYMDISHIETIDIKEK